MKHTSQFAPRYRRAAYILCAAAWAAAFLATHTPVQHLPKLHATDVVLHGGGYAILSLLFGLALLARGIPLRKRNVIIAITMMTYGIGDELTQPLFGRHAAFSDWLADVTGVVIAIALMCLIAAAKGLRRNKA